MTQPIDVAYVDIVANTRDFRRDLKRDLDKSFDVAEKDSHKTVKRIEKSFGDMNLSIGGVFKNLRNVAGKALETFAEAAQGAVKGLTQFGEVSGNVVGSVTKLGQGAAGVAAGIGELAATGPVGLAVLAASLAAAAVAAVALTAAIATAAAALQALITIASFAAAALPGAALAAAAGFGVLAIAMNGVVEAFQEQSEGAKKAGAAGASSARQVADAQRGVLQAQKDVIKAREEEIKRVQTLAVELNRARVTEARAIDDVKNAQLELADARRLNSPRAEAEAQLRLDEANASLLEARDRTKNLAADKAKADKTGIAGSDRVLAAQEALIDAQDRLAQSQQRVGGGAAAQATAFSKLSKSAQLFVSALVSAKNALAPVAKGIQEAFFSGTAPLVQPIVDNVKALQPELNRVAAGFGKIFQEVLKFLGSPEARGALDSILTGLAEFLEAAAPAVKPLLEAFAGLAGQGGEFGKTLGTTVADALLKIADFVSKIDLKKLFDDAKKALNLLLPVIVPLVRITADLFRIFATVGLPLLTSLGRILPPIAEGFNKVTNAIVSALGQFGEFIRSMQAKFETLKASFKDLPKTITDLGSKFAAAGKELIKKFWEGLGASADFVSDFGKKLANGIISAINNNVLPVLNGAIGRVQDGLNSLPLVDGVKLPRFPNIPKLAKGGLGVKNSLVEISEGNHQEAVIPLENRAVLSKVGTAIAEAGGASGPSGGDIQVLVFLGNEPIKAQAVKVVDASNKRTARSVKQIPRMI